MAAGGSAENAELVLQADDVYVADVEEVRGAQIGRQVLLLNLEANHFRVFVASLMSLTDTARHWLAGCAAATAASRSDVNVAMPHFARQVVADKGDPTNFGSFDRVCFLPPGRLFTRSGVERMFPGSEWISRSRWTLG